MTHVENPAAAPSQGQKRPHGPHWPYNGERAGSRGVELLGELTRIEDSYLFCYVRGPEGIIVAFAEKLGRRSATRTCDLTRPRK